ncbi:hypothetical protein BGZ54_002637 [Gamsiella multidivaricata]|nr:hypothetical protein BGZ54_002637 [Gamsiella multidivaricata]
MIFTWIEGTFGNDNEDRRNEYLNEINEVDPDAVLPIGKELTLGTKQNEKPAVDKTDYFEDGVAKAGSLRLLVRALQDDTFKSPTFMESRKEMGAVVEIDVTDPIQKHKDAIPIIEGQSRVQPADIRLLPLRQEQQQQGRYEQQMRWLQQVFMQQISQLWQLQLGGQPSSMPHSQWPPLRSTFLPALAAFPPMPPPRSNSLARKRRKHTAWIPYTSNLFYQRIHIHVITIEEMEWPTDAPPYIQPPNSAAQEHFQELIKETFDERIEKARRSEARRLSNEDRLIYVHLFIYIATFANAPRATGRDTIQRAARARIEAAYGLSANAVKRQTIPAIRPIIVAYFTRHLARLPKLLAADQDLETPKTNISQQVQRPDDQAQALNKVKLTKAIDDSAGSVPCNVRFPKNISLVPERDLLTR